MKTLAKQLLDLQRSFSAGQITEEEYKQIVRERSGALLRQGGRLIKHALPSQAYAEKRGLDGQKTVTKVRTVTGAQPDAVNIGLHVPSLAGKTMRSLKVRRDAPTMERSADVSIALALHRVGVSEHYRSMVKLIRAGNKPIPNPVIA